MPLPILPPHNLHHKTTEAWDPGAYLDLLLPSDKEISNRTEMPKVIWTLKDSEWKYVGEKMLRSFVFRCHKEIIPPTSLGNP